MSVIDDVRDYASGVVDKMITHLGKGMESGLDDETMFVSLMTLASSPGRAPGAVAAEALIRLARITRGSQEIQDQAKADEITKAEADALLAVATLYVDAFAADETMSLPEKLRLQEVEQIVAKHGRRT